MNEPFSADYISIIKRLVPLMLTGGVMAIILHSSEIISKRPWFRVVSEAISIFAIGSAAAFVSALTIPYLPYIDNLPETHLLVAAMAGVGGQKTFDFIQKKVFKTLYGMGEVKGRRSSDGR